MSLPSPDGLQVILGLTGIAAIWVGWLKWLRSGAKRRLAKMAGFIEAIAGREQIIDKASGIVKAPAVPPLGVRLASIDETMQKLVTVIDATHNHELRLTAVESDVDGLKRAADERIATANVSTEMLKLVRDRDTIDGESDET